MMKLSKLLTVLLIFTFTNSASAGGDSSWNSFFFDGIVTRLEKFEDIYKFLNKTGIKFAYETLLDSSLTPAQRISNIVKLTEDLSAVLEEADSRTSPENFSSAILKFVESFSSLTSSKLEKIQNLDLTVSSGLILVQDIEYEVLSFTADSFGITVDQVEEALEGINSSALFKLNFVIKYLKRIRESKVSLSSDFQEQSKLLIKLINWSDLNHR